MARSVPEWVGKSPDSRPPTSVRLRVFAKYEGRCYLSGLRIGLKDKWELEHVKPLHLARDGENLNRESNLAPALKVAHAIKTAGEITAKAKCDRVRAKHLGTWPPPLRKMQGRPFPRRGA